MFKVNDYVMYGSMGVCKVIGISKEKYIDGEEIECYVLQTIYKNTMTIKTPVNNPKVLMREVMTKDAVLSLMDIMAKTETIWIDDDRQRSANFKAALKTGKSEDCMMIIKTLHQKKENAPGSKKLRKMDEDILKAAEKQLYEEFAIALDIQPEEVVPYILNRIS